MSTQTIKQEIPAGTYVVDPVHSSIGFAVIHNGVSTFRSGFRDYEARLTGGEAPQLEGRSRSPASTSTRSSSRATSSPPTSSTPSATRSFASSRPSSSVDEDGSLTAARRAGDQGREARGRGERPLRASSAPTSAAAPGRALAGGHGRPPRLRPRLERRAAERRRGPRLRGEHRGRARAGRGGRVAMRVLGISGSLRRDSLNSALLRAAAERLPAGVELVDVRAAGARSRRTTRTPRRRPAPEAVRELREAIRAADAVLIATPEYNHSLPGQLKNALDWASRPAGAERAERQAGGGDRRLEGMFGAVWAQAELRKVLARDGRPRGRGGAAGRPRARAARGRAPGAGAASSPSSWRRSSPSWSPPRSRGGRVRPSRRVAS